MSRRDEHEAIETWLVDLQDSPGVLPKLDGVVIGRLSAPGEGGQLQVEFAGCPGGKPVAARSITPLDERSVGAEVAVTFEGSDPTRPIVLGPLHTTLQSQPPADDELALINVQADDERVEICARREIVLRVGKASITLTEAGKVLIRGAYVLSRSSGVNRIKGGSIQLN